MNEDLAQLVMRVELSVAGLKSRFDVPTYYFDNAMRDLKEYLNSKEITEPQRKCTDKTHHYKGCDCW